MRVEWSSGMRSIRKHGVSGVKGVMVVVVVVKGRRRGASGGVVKALEHAQAERCLSE